MAPVTHTEQGLDAFRTASMEFDAVYGRLAKACGLSGPEFWSLQLIHEGVETQREISELLSLSRQTVNSAFKLLVGKGLIRLVPRAQDQRSKQVILTQEGKQFVAANVVRVQRLEEQAWQTLSPREQESLIQLTRRYTAALLASIQRSQC